MFFSLYLAKKTVEKSDMERRMGSIPFRYYFHSAIRKIYQNEDAKLYALSHIKLRLQEHFIDEFQSLPTFHGDLGDKNNPFTQDLLAKFSPAVAFVAQHYLGIGTFMFLSKRVVAKKMASYLAWKTYDDDAVRDLARKALTEIIKSDYLDDYYGLLIRSENRIMIGMILNVLEELLHEQTREQNSQENTVARPKKVKKSLEHIYTLRECERLSANLKRGYLFGDIFLNVNVLSKAKEITIKAMTHHEGLLKISKKSHRMGGMKVFLAIAIFINFIDDQSFSVKEIASILDMKVTDVSDILHTKIGDFITLLPEEMKISHAQKLSFS